MCNELKRLVRTAAAVLAVLQSFAAVTLLNATWAAPAYAQGPSLEGNRLSVAGSWKLKSTGGPAADDEEEFTLFIKRKDAVEQVIELTTDPITVVDSDPGGWFMDIMSSGDVPGTECPTRASCLPAYVVLEVVSPDRFILYLEEDFDPPADDVVLTFDRITCGITLQPGTALVSRDGAVGQAFNVTAGPACFWNTTSSDVSWLRVTANGTGAGARTIVYDVSRNLTGSTRTGTIRVKNDPDRELFADFTVTQDSLGTAILEITLDDRPFRGVPVGQQSPPVTATVRNTGDGQIDVTGIVACPPRFTVSSAPSGTTPLPPGSSFQFQLVFAPAMAGADTCTLAFPPYSGSFTVTGIGGQQCDPTGRPAPPENFGSQVIGNRVSLTWNAAAHCATADGFVLEAGSSFGASNLLTMPLGNVTSFSADAPTGRYFVRLRAVNVVGQSPPTPDLRLDTGCTSPPGPPIGTTASFLAGGAVLISWSAGAGNIERYIVEAGSSPGAANLAVLAVGAPATSFVGTAPPGTYFLRVRAANACGISVPSSEVSIVVGANVPIPAAPGTPTATVTGSTVTVEWTPPATSSPIRGYILEAGSGPGLSDLAVVNVGPVTSYTARGVPAGTYYVRVRAVNDAGTGPPSTDATVVVPR